MFTFYKSKKKPKTLQKKGQTPASIFCVFPLNYSVTTGFWTIISLLEVHHLFILSQD